MVGEPPWTYITRIAQSIVETKSAKVFNHNTAITYEQWLEYPDGRKELFELRKCRSTVRWRHLGLVGFGRDITERKRHEESLEKASRDKTTFIRRLAMSCARLLWHCWLSRMLLDTPLSGEQRKHLQTINVRLQRRSVTSLTTLLIWDGFDRRKRAFPQRSISRSSLWLKLKC